MYTGYSNTTIKIKHNKATELYYKGDNQLPQLVMFNDQHIAELNNLDVGYYVLQFMLNGEVLSQDTLEVKQNIAYADQSYSPSSQARQILQAIDDYLAGIASSQQRRVRIGDKQIEYSSYDELMKWRDYYAKLVRKEENKSTSIRLEKIYYRERI